MRAGTPARRLAILLLVSAGPAWAQTALRMALSRLLRHYRTALENEVRQTVDGEEEVAGELAYLRRLFSGQ